MINAVIIEDEKPALDNLMRSFREVDYSIEANTVLPSVEEAIDYFSMPHTQPDIIFSDVQLGDGLSFSIFKEVAIKSPVIFITGYDQFMMNAFDHNGIDYLLKPVDTKDLDKALHKYESLRHHFSGTQPHAIENMLQYTKEKKRTRIVARRGVENLVLKMEDVVLFYTENKVVYVLDNEGRKFLCDKTLTELEAELDNSVFFRANRQYILNISYIKSYRSYEKVKLQVDIADAAQKHSVVISQETATEFRRWITEN